MPAKVLLGGLTDVKALTRYAALVGDVGTNLDPVTGRANASEHVTDRKALRADEGPAPSPTGTAC